MVNKRDVLITVILAMILLGLAIQLFFPTLAGEAVKVTKTVVMHDIETGRIYVQLAVGLSFAALLAIIVSYFKSNPSPVTEINTPPLDIQPVAPIKLAPAYKKEVREEKKEAPKADIHTEVNSTLSEIKKRLKEINEQL